MATTETTTTRQARAKYALRRSRLTHRALRAGARWDRAMQTNDTAELERAVLWLRAWTRALAEEVAAERHSHYDPAPPVPTLGEALKRVGVTDVFISTVDE